MKKSILLCCILFLLVTGKVYATLGVGVGVGKIRVDQQLRPGQIYTLPPITVLNTGDQPSDYQVAIEHQEKQPQLIPKDEWFSFSPKTFHLEPKKVQTVKITLNLPIKAVPGDYFVYLEAQPVKKAVNGVTAVNIAAATKLYFTIIPATLLAAIYYKLLSLWIAFSPVPQIILCLIAVVACIMILKRFIHIEVKHHKKNTPRWLIAVGAAILIILYILIWMKFFKQI